MTSPTENTAPEAPEGFRLNGRRVLIILVCAFGVVFAVNGYMLWRAVTSFPGTVTESSYRASQGFNKEIAAAQAQVARSWQVAATAERGADGATAIRVEARDADGKPITGPTFHARLEHPATRTLDRAVTLAASEPGVWGGVVADVGPGKWGLVIDATGPEGRLFLSQNTVFFKETAAPAR